MSLDDLHVEYIEKGGIGPEKWMEAFKELSILIARKLQQRYKQFRWNIRVANNIAHIETSNYKVGAPHTSVLLYGVVMVTKNFLTLLT